MGDVERSPTGTDLSGTRRHICERTEADQAGSGGWLPVGLKGGLLFQQPAAWTQSIYDGNAKA